ncbi:MAG: S41 family peptidase [Anaerovibrio sp.]|nr:S41 family peptidase [Anaerovibrio sp.]
MKRIILTSLLTALIVAAGIFAGLYGLLGGSMENVSQIARLVTTMRFVEAKYVDDVPAVKLVDGAIEGMVKALGDKHSVYMDDATFRQLMQQTEGSFGGVGVVMGFPEPGHCEIMSVMENTPSAQQGLQPKDEILRIDGKEVAGMQPEEMANMVRGTEGTQVVLTIRRQGQEDFEVTLTRAVIQLTTAKGIMIDDAGIGYIRIASFSENTGKEFQQELAALKEQGMKGLVVDLRANPGGLITSCVEISNQLIPAGEIVSMIDRDGNKSVFESELAERDYPLAVIIDGNSASASEILAGAVQDRQCGTIVGVKSFGKGSVQTMLPLTHGDGLKLTVARYYTPSGRSIDGTGIEPDIYVELPEGAAQDVQLLRAIAAVKEKLAQ